MNKLLLDFRYHLATTLAGSECPCLRIFSSFFGSLVSASASPPSRCREFVDPHVRETPSAGASRRAPSSWCIPLAAMISAAASGSLQRVQFAGSGHCLVACSRDDSTRWQRVFISWQRDMPAPGHPVAHAVADLIRCSGKLFAVSKNPTEHHHVDL